MTNVRLFAGLLLIALLVFHGEGRAQESPSRHRATLLRYVGQEVLVVDTTGGIPQFQSTDALQLFRLTLDAVRRDYIMVSRNTEGDKRTFIYPLVRIRRVTTASAGVPLRPILIEMY
jgi:hypothetical protein